VFLPYAEDLAKQPLGDVARWLRAHLAPLRQGIALLDTVTSVGRRAEDPGAGHTTLASARAAVAVAHAAQRETAAFATRAMTDRRLLGPWYRGLDTNADGLREAAPNGMTGYEPMGELLRRALDVTRQQPGPYATADHRDLLGRYGADGHPDTEALSAALHAAHLVARLAPDNLADTARRSRLADTLAGEKPEPRELLRQTEQIRGELDHWHEYARQPHLAGVGPVLADRPLDQAAVWLRAHLEPFEDAVDLIHSVARVMDDTACLTLARAREAVAAVVSARAAESRFAENDAAYRGLLGSL
jgi:hypothetical protein